MSRMLDRLAALDRRVLGPGQSRADEYLDGYNDWWSRAEPNVKWAALLGYAAGIGLGNRRPVLALRLPGEPRRGGHRRVTYWSLIWHLYLRHRLRER